MEKKIVIHSIYLLFGVFLLSNSSCKKDSKDTTNNVVLGYDYYPMQKNKYVVFNVEDITIDAAVGKFDTSRYQIKEVLTDTIFSEIKNVVSYKLERFWRKDTTQTWNIMNVWKVQQSSTNVIRIEENIPYVKLVFPMIEEQSWNINRYDTLPEKNCTLKLYDKVDTVNGKIFEKTAQTVQNDFESIYQKQYETEKYVRGVGLVFKQLIDIESQTKDNKHPIDINKPIMKRITSGTITTWKIYSHNYHSK